MRQRVRKRERTYKWSERDRRCVRSEREWMREKGLKKGGGDEWRGITSQEERENEYETKSKSQWERQSHRVRGERESE
tara:strand:- start:249 stop:482 length:234 start_codon:yes stop_codon:yes gene_type:complete